MLGAWRPAEPAVEAADFLAQRVAELQRDAAAAEADAAAARAECAALLAEQDAAREREAALRKQIADLRDQVTVLEEGQSFLLQKHKQVVAQYHARLRRAREECAEGQERLRAWQQQEQQRKQQEEQEQAALAALQQQQQQQPNRDVAELVAVVGDLQRAIDEKNELIDMMQEQLCCSEEACAEAKLRAQDLEDELCKERRSRGGRGGGRGGRRGSRSGGRAQTPQSAVRRTSLSPLRSVPESPAPPQWLLDQFGRREEEREERIRSLESQVTVLRRQLAATGTRPASPPSAAQPRQSRALSPHPANARGGSPVLSPAGMLHHMRARPGQVRSPRASPAPPEPADDAAEAKEQSSAKDGPGATAIPPPPLQCRPRPAPPPMSPPPHPAVPPPSPVVRTYTPLSLAAGSSAAWAAPLPPVPPLPPRSPRPGAGSPLPAAFALSPRAEARTPSPLSRIAQRMRVSPERTLAPLGGLPLPLHPAAPPPAAHVSPPRPRFAMPP